MAPFASASHLCYAVAIKVRLAQYTALAPAMCASAAASIFCSTPAALASNTVWTHIGWCNMHSMFCTYFCSGLRSCITRMLLHKYAPLFLGRVPWGIGVGFGDHCAFIYTAGRLFASPAIFAITHNLSCRSFISQALIQPSALPATPMGFLSVSCHAAFLRRSTTSTHEARASASLYSPS